MKSNGKVQYVALTLPYSAQIMRNGLGKPVLVLEVPLRDFGSLFSTEAVQSTEVVLGKVEGSELLEHIADHYFEEICIRQMKKTDVPNEMKPQAFVINEPPHVDLQSAFDAADEISP